MKEIPLFDPNRESCRSCRNFKICDGLGMCCVLPTAENQIDRGGLSPREFSRLMQEVGKRIRRYGCGGYDLSDLNK
ncbi:hypothetical protein GF362_01935 [Candidatus Dojkabacteria bacterium]|nr:hypothetical protein [Candidatus Dojkabacteria bacterium]